MKHIVIDPRDRRVGRGFFIRELIVPNIGAFVLILIIRILEVGTAGDLIIYSLAAVLLWSGNIAAPMARLHDLGINGLWHIGVVGVVFYLTTIGLNSGPGEAAMRFADWSVGVLDGDDGPEASGRAAQLGGLFALCELVALALLPGQKGANSFGPDPREKV
ncbi:MAG: DUF805 domain-containing protein [Pseudomonadota bacterium]